MDDVHTLPGEFLKTKQQIDKLMTIITTVAKMYTY